MILRRTPDSLAATRDPWHARSWDRASTAYRFYVTSYVHVEGALTAVYLNNGLGMACAFFIGIGVSLMSEFYSFRPSSITSTLGVSSALILIYDTALRARPELLGDTVLAALSTGLLLYFLPRIPALARLAGAKWISGLAALSYAIYLFHWPVLNAIVAVGHLGKGNQSFTILTIGTLVILTPIVYAAHRYVEHPFLVIKEKQR